MKLQSINTIAIVGLILLSKSWAVGASFSPAIEFEKAGFSCVRSIGGYVLRKNPLTRSTVENMFQSTPFLLRTGQVTEEELGLLQKLYESYRFNTVTHSLTATIWARQSIEYLISDFRGKREDFVKHIKNQIDWVNGDRQESTVAEAVKIEPLASALRRLELIGRKVVFTDKLIQNGQKTEENITTVGTRSMLSFPGQIALAILNLDQSSELDQNYLLISSFVKQKIREVETQRKVKITDAQIAERARYLTAFIFSLDNYRKVLEFYAKYAVVHPEEINQEMENALVSAKLDHTALSQYFIVASPHSDDIFPYLVRFGWLGLDYSNIRDLANAQQARRP